MSETNQMPTDSTGDQTENAAGVGSKVVARTTRRTKRGNYTEADVSLRFTSCGRCGLFLTAYRLNHNEEFLTAIEEIEADWLTLPWHHDMRELVNKSYGCPIDVQSYFLEGSCPECNRPFSYAEPDPEQSAWFLVKL